MCIKNSIKILKKKKNPKLPPPVYKISRRTYRLNIFRPIYIDSYRRSLTNSLVIVRETYPRNRPPIANSIYRDNVSLISAVSFAKYHFPLIEDGIAIWPILSSIRLMPILPYIVLQRFRL